jgi:hypothetical protein
MGSPCLIPLVGLKYSENWPFTLTEKDTVSTHFMIRLTQVGEKPSFSTMALK